MPLLAETSNDLAAESDSAGAVLSASDRERILSALGIKLKLALFVVVVLTLLGLAMVALVTRIFSELTPSIENDLRWKVERGVQDIAIRIQYEVAVNDPALVKGRLTDYLRDPDLVGVTVENMDGQTMFSQGRPVQLTEIDGKRQGVAHDFQDVFAAWHVSSIENVTVGRVALSISKKRIQAGQNLRKEIIVATVLGASIAMLFCLLFVNLYIGPILTLTADAFSRLEVTTEKALEAARLKSQFLANMSHEIRTPMNGILGMVALIKGTRQTTTQKRYTQTIEGSAKALLGIIDDVLDFSKLEAQKLKLRPEHFELSELLQDICDLLAPKAHDKRVDLILHQAAEVPDRLFADPDRLRQVLMNLIGNAIKFTEQGYITVRVEFEHSDETDVTLTFYITDTGPGIALKDQQKLFKSFSQIDGSLTRAHGGTGLGLAICKHLAEAMGGQIGLKSEVGRGSTFFFSVRAGATPALPSIPSEPQQSSSAPLLIIAHHELQRTHLAGLVAAWHSHATAVEDCGAALAKLTSEPALAEPFEAVIIDMPVAEPDPGYEALVDLCIVEDVPILCLASALTPFTAPVPSARHTSIAKPVRATELYDTLVALITGNLPVASSTYSSLPPTSDSAPPSERPMANPHAPRILVVDDNAINRTVAVELLCEMGYPADIACNGLEAVQQVESGNYGAILMDCQMPVMDGYEAVGRIRKLSGEVAHTPIIAVTAHALAGDRERVRSAGMNDYMTKPVNAHTLERKLAHWLGPQRDKKMPRSPTTDRPSETQQPATPSKLPILDPKMRRSPRAQALFLVSMPTDAETLLRHADLGDVLQVQSLAHRMKGACLSLGVSACAAACRDVEEKACVCRPGSRLPTCARVGRGLVTVIALAGRAYTRTILRLGAIRTGRSLLGWFVDRFDGGAGSIRALITCRTPDILTNGHTRTGKTTLPRHASDGQATSFHTQTTIEIALLPLAATSAIAA